MMNNDIQITLENVSRSDPIMDDQWDPMREEFENPDINCYDHGPGANLDVDLQRPAYRDRNNQVVYKIMVTKIPYGLEQTGLENLFRNVGVPTVAKCKGRASNQLQWALIEFKTLQEAKRAIMEFDGVFDMIVRFARSDEENERLKNKRLQEEREERMYQMAHSSTSNNSLQANPNKVQNTMPSSLKLIRMLGRGQSRGKMIFNVFNGYQERRPGLKHCAWSNGVPDMRDPGGLMYHSASCQHELSNRVLQNLVITTGSNSVRQVSMGRGYIPPHTEPIPGQCDPFERSVGVDVSVPLLHCAKCGSNTVQKCSSCGTPYCSKKCQREDFGRHRTRCRAQISIDSVVDENMQRTSEFVPLSRNIGQGETSSFSTNLPSISLWGKPEKNVVSLLGEGTEAIVYVSSEQPTQLSGSLCCKELFDITNKILTEMPEKVMQSPANLNFWPTVGTLVAVKWDSSIWRGYILNTPIVGHSSHFTVALCDLGSVKKIEVKDIFQLPSDFHNLPELAVTCKLLELSGKGSTLAPENQLQLKIENSLGDRLTAKAVGVDGLTELGVVTVSSWSPAANELVAVQIVPPCTVVMTAYHNQNALYVRPTGRTYKEQFFCLMQKVAAAHVTSPPLGRAPYKGEMVACQYRKDGNYYRGIVREESTLIQEHYEVFFVDFGNMEPISISDMKALPSELKSCPCMAVPVAPYGVRKGPLTEKAVVFLNMLLQKEQEFQMDFATQNKNDGVQLVFPDKSSFNLKLNESLAPEWEESLKKGLLVDHDKPTMLEDLSILSLVEGGKQKGVVTVMVMNISANGRLAVLPMGTPEVEHVLKTVAFQINEYCESTDPSARYNPRLNEVCLAKYHKDGQWYRAVNTETVTETQSSKLMFIDYGNCEDVPFQDIRQMVPDFVSPPIVMLMCHLDGVPMEPTPDMITRIMELVPTKNVYEVEVLGQIDSYQYKIRIPQISDQLKSELSMNQ
ncbi:tudor domain-containing protein 1 isoform X2 [Thrips palmi]|nr:tudor domain-containing protein 1 isoform X2 [Thrips palmi]